LVRVSSGHLGFDELDAFQENSAQGSRCVPCRGTIVVVQVANVNIGINVSRG